jgi:hypothetical protein
MKTFLNIFATALGKWLACRLQKPTPCSFVSMLPSFCFRHVDDDDAEPCDPDQDPCLLSLAYLIKPTPAPGEPGLSPKLGRVKEEQKSELYLEQAKQILGKSFSTEDVDLLLSGNTQIRREMVDETKRLLVGCGFDPQEVSTYLAKHR